ncbi:hypothetical protein FB451DRAFT_472137 [Mycena latifolia]|nr:hypothetical protein FB451DRAFT_472137 [Mycena latifolia]
MRLATAKPLSPCLTHPEPTASPPTPYHAHTLTPGPRAPQIRCAAGAVVPRCARCPCQRRSSAHRSRDVRHLCVAPAASSPRRIRSFPRLSPVTTISGTAPLSPSAPTPFAQPQLPSAPPPACAAHPPRAQHLLPPYSIAAIALIATRRTTTVFSRILPSPLGACASAHARPDVHYHLRAQRLPRPFLLAGVPRVASALPATSSAPFYSKPVSATEQKYGAQPQRPGCRSPASPSSPPRALRRSSW